MSDHNETTWFWVVTAVLVLLWLVSNLRTDELTPSAATTPVTTKAKGKANPNYANSNAAKISKLRKSPQDAFRLELPKNSPLDSYTFASKTPLGAGGYGTTHLVTKDKGPNSGRKFVLKRIPVKTFDAANEALREAQHLQRLRHPNVVQVFDAFLHAEGRVLEVAIVIEYCPLGGCWHRVI